MKKYYRFIFLLISYVWVQLPIFAQTTSFKILVDEIQQLQKQLVPDKRQAILEVELRDTLQPALVVFGETDLPEAKQQIVNFLHEEKISFIDSIRVLPDEKVGNKTWALVNLSVANVRAKPGDASELVTQVLLGTPLKVLDYSNKWYRVQTPEYYIGYVDAGGLTPINKQELDNWKNANRWMFNRISGFIYDAPGYSAQIVSDAVLGDLMVVENSKKDWLKIRFPDGRTGFVNKKECLQFADWVNLPIRANPILTTASKMMGFPYLWGGTSTKGIDCSGFVKTVFYAQGVILPRDASQQVRYGEPVKFENLDNLQPGDLLFFGRSAGRVTHVGIYISEGNFIHSSGRVHIGNILPGDPKHDAARNLVAVRRILNSTGNEGIVRVKSHPWYNP